MQRKGVGDGVALSEGEPEEAADDSEADALLKLASVHLSQSEIEPEDEDEDDAGLWMDEVRLPWYFVYWRC